MSELDFQRQAAAAAAVTSIRATYDKFLDIAHDESAESQPQYFQDVIRTFLLSLHSPFTSGLVTDIWGSLLT